MSKYLLLFCFLQIPLFAFSQQKFDNLEYSKNILNFKGASTKSDDRSSLVFTDKGAWFGFGFLEPGISKIGFSGPFLLTEQNGFWLSPDYFFLILHNDGPHLAIDWSKDKLSQKSYNSHLEQVFQSDKVAVKQELLFQSGHTAIMRTRITNLDSTEKKYKYYYVCNSLPNNFSIFESHSRLKITSDKSNALGYISFLNQKPEFNDKNNKTISSPLILSLKPNESYDDIIGITFIYPQYNTEMELKKLDDLNFDFLLDSLKKDKDSQLQKLISRKKKIYSDDKYSKLISKCVLTLQTNHRIAAEGLHHQGLFPSYNSNYFNGFWAWDSWKHAAALALFDPELAKDQVRAMFDYQQADGFIPDCIFPDTIHESNNYRNTKPPLSAWAVWKIYTETVDKDFLKEMYPKIIKYHNWWYENRDHDNDRIAEYGSADGSLVAAKWESGMDNAVRFDDSKILKNKDNAYSLDQESVDLNSFLYLEKTLLGKMAKILNLKNESKAFQSEAKSLKSRIQVQFWDDEKGWFFDTSLDGLIKNENMGSEGWIPLWTEVADKHQARSLKDKMINEQFFNTFVPLPTLSAHNPEFKPDNGYWRGPVWIDQSWFGINGLEKYGFREEAEKLAHKLIHNAEGVLDTGKAIRENYQPLNGKGLEAQNFSWSAAHYLMLIMKD